MEKDCMFKSKKFIVIFIISLLVMVVAGISLYAQFGALGKIIDTDGNDFDAEIVGFAHPQSKYLYDDHIVGYDVDGKGVNIYFRGSPTLVNVKKEPAYIHVGDEKALHYRLYYKGLERHVYIKTRASLTYKDYIKNDEPKKIYFEDIYAVSISY
jgi:hypothetical protein